MHATSIDYTPTDVIVNCISLTQAFAALDTYTLQNVVPRVRNGIELAHNMGTLLPTGSPRSGYMLREHALGSSQV